MYNYDHEIFRPEERAMYKFLWCNYFKDSDILNVEMETGKSCCVFITLKSDRDELDEWPKFHGDYEKWLKHIEDNREKYIYTLKFTHAVYLERKQTGELESVFLSGRFKKTALLYRMQEKTGKRLYHLRIHTTDGLVDVIFEGFEIRRRRGRVNYAPTNIMPPEEMSEFDKEMAAEEEYSGLADTDSECYKMLYRYYQIMHPALTEAARAAVRLDGSFKKSRLYSAYLLGKAGDRTDIPRITELIYETKEKVLHERFCAYSMSVQCEKNLLDAIESILYREDHRDADFMSDQIEDYRLLLCQGECEML